MKATLKSADYWLQKAREYRQNEDWQAAISCLTNAFVHTDNAIASAKKAFQTIVAEKVPDTMAEIAAKELKLIG